MKSKYVPVRMSDEMANLVDQLKEKHGLRGRASVIREAIQVMAKSDQPQLTREMLVLFEAWRKGYYRVGSNLNQIAYKLNSGHPLSTDEILNALEDLKREFKTHADNMRKFRRGLGL
ncbi:hypothetical protein [Pseudodesulfovibrio karagichevae]|uniref:Mobilisation protein (MobC) n=1 Tax=Pseudodesulfovibrio karagichevae TaxID=3239305 RepID=A0ABV4K7H2_9BACT